MINRIAFQNRLKTYNLYTKVNDSQMRGINYIIDYWESNKLYVDKRWLAYILATAYHETGRVMETVEELGKGLRRPYGEKIKQSKRRYTVPDKLYYGRGLVQITWYENYQKFSNIIGIDLLNNPEEAMRMSTAIHIMFTGMTDGLFTGVNLSRYFNDIREDYVNARKIINGTDCAEKIAVYARSFYQCLI
jgi:putative chitinase